MTTTTTTTCPAWCTDHNGFDDGSDNWHRSWNVEIHGFVFYTSTGTWTGETEVFMPQHGAGDGMTLRQAEDVANALLELVKAARA